MLSIRTTLGTCAWAAIVFPSSLRTQAPDRDTVAIQTAAARAAMMYMPMREDGRATRGLNPMVVSSVVNPELAGTRARESALNARLAEAGGFVLRSPADICSYDGCELRDLAAYLSMSDPVIESDSAVVTVNILTPNPRPKAVYYESYRFGFANEEDQWRLLWIDDLRTSRPQRTWILQPRKDRRPNKEL